MYRENEFSVRRDGADDEYLRRMLSGGCAEGDDGKGEDGLPHRKGWGLVGYPLAMVYSPLQEWRELYDNETGLSHGTIFKELDLPFMGAWDDTTPSCGRGCGGVKNG